MEPLAERALQAVEKGQLTILPERFEKVNAWIFHSDSLER
jgi:valyl-tRNA synthetase